MNKGGETQRSLETILSTIASETVTDDPVVDFLAGLHFFAKFSTDRRILGRIAGVLQVPPPPLSCPSVMSLPCRPLSDPVTPCLCSMPLLAAPHHLTPCALCPLPPRVRCAA